MKLNTEMRIPTDKKQKKIMDELKPLLNKVN